jgi:hypothetical protein
LEANSPFDYNISHESLSRIQFLNVSILVHTPGRVRVGNTFTPGMKIVWQEQFVKLGWTIYERQGKPLSMTIGDGK